MSGLLPQTTQAKLGPRGYQLISTQGAKEILQTWLERMPFDSLVYEVLEMSVNPRAAYQYKT